MSPSRWLRFTACATTILWSLAAAPLWAKDEPPSGDKASWAFSYLLVVLLVALGLMAVCRPGRRTSEFKRDTSDE